jgi:hypothetical protein
MKSALAAGGYPAASATQGRTRGCALGRSDRAVDVGLRPTPKAVVSRRRNYSARSGRFSGEDHPPTIRGSRRGGLPNDSQALSCARAVDNSRWAWACASSALALASNVCTASAPAAPGRTLPSSASRRCAACFLGAQSVSGPHPWSADRYSTFVLLAAAARAGIVSTCVSHSDLRSDAVATLAQR